MPARLRRLLLAVPLLLVLLGFAGPAGSSAATQFYAHTYFASAYERQIDSRTCVAASTAMMMNIMNGHDMNFSQLTILRYAQKHDALNDAVQRGSDPLGWSLAASYFSQNTIRPTTYRWEAYDTESAALRRAATQIVRYGKAVGLLVKNGGHAVVMTGYTATANPLKGPFKLTGIYYSDPLGPRHQYVTPGNSPLSKYLQTDATATYDRLWYGKYIVIVPHN
ncbi:MAG TPA: C39 family peptidase [Candidatus Limnocylindrales bacterium]|nr:C39 family peptidase [Candidatus Limnocylindrales bacterium]